jgi:hypothetical protein
VLRPSPRSAWPAALLLLLLVLPRPSLARAGTPGLPFDGVSTYVEVPDSADFSVPTTGGLTVAAWLRPDTLTFPTTEGSGYIYWLGKGEAGRQEWTFRMYSRDNSEGRGNRISFYLFNPDGGLGIGSYFQDAITPGEWIHVVGVADAQHTAIYKNGVFRRCDLYRGGSESGCQRYTGLAVTPQRGTAPLRMGTRDLHSFFLGALADVFIWDRPLSADEIAALYQQNVVPSDGLVAEYPLDETGGSVVHDDLGVHNGTIVGAPWGGARLLPSGSHGLAAARSLSQVRPPLPEPLAVLPETVFTRSRSSRRGLRA